MGASPDVSIRVYMGDSKPSFEKNAIKLIEQDTPTAVTAGSIVRHFNIDGDLIFEPSIIEGRKSQCKTNYADHYLAIDDLGTETLGRHYGNQVKRFSRGFNARYEKKTLTHATSNLALEDLQQVYGDRIFDRMIELFNDIPLEGKSRRK
jgi:hypothetical protein